MISRRRVALAAACAALTVITVIAALAVPWPSVAQGAAGEQAVVASAERAAHPPSALSWRACRLRGLDHDAQCTTLRRPLDPSHPGAYRFDLQVALLPALARQKEADPVFFFAGGPGQSAIALAGTIEALMARLGERRDIVLVDQRGTGRSAPLQCDSPSEEEALRRAIDRDRLVAGLLACRDALQRLPWGDLRYFTTWLAAGDAEAVREALGAQAIDLVGVSYGTRVALEYLRRYPAHVRRMVLDGVAPPDMALPESGDRDGEAALQALIHDCTEDEACARAHPALQAEWRRLVSTTTPSLPLADPMTGKAQPGVLTPRSIYDLVRPALYQPALGAVLPHAIDEAAAGRYGPLLALGAAQAGTSPADVSEGEHFSVICSEDLPRLTPSPPADGPRYDEIYRAVCAGWPRGEVPEGFYAIERSPVPVLLLSGGIDPVTPPRHAARVAAALGPMARHAVVAHSSHGVLALACVRDMVQRFVAAAEPGDALAVDLHCADAVPRPTDFVPPRPSLASSAPNDPRSYGIDPPEDPPGAARARLQAGAGGRAR